MEERNDGLTRVYAVRCTSVGDPYIAFSTYEEAAIVAERSVFGDTTVDDYIVAIPLFASMEVV